MGSEPDATASWPSTSRLDGRKDSALVHPITGWPQGFELDTVLQRSLPQSIVPMVAGIRTGS